MATTLKEKIGSFGAKRRKRIEARAAELINEEMTLRDLRRAHHLTQERMAELLGTGQESVSRLEVRTDLLISTLSKYLKSMGGRLRLVVEFPDRPPVVLSGLAGMDDNQPERHKRTEARH